MSIGKKTVNYQKTSKFKQLFRKTPLFNEKLSLTNCINQRIIEEKRHFCCLSVIGKSVNPARAE
jgi:hypothetical protein